jgi:hypothetical protein
LEANAVMDPAFKGLHQGRALWLLWQCLDAFEGDAEKALTWCENYTDSSPALKIMLKEVVKRKRAHQFLPRRHRSDRHG